MRLLVERAGGMLELCDIGVSCTFIVKGWSSGEARIAKIFSFGEMRYVVNVL